jgi:hypothetical protein
MDTIFHCGFSGIILKGTGMDFQMFTSIMYFIFRDHFGKDWYFSNLISFIFWW